jgi:hypothetical protein
VADVSTLALVAILGAAAGVLGGLLITGAYALRNVHIAKRWKTTEGGAMGTEAAQGREVVVHELKVVVHDTVSVTASANTQTSGVVAEPTRSYSSQPMLVSPKIQVSDSTERVA